MIAALGKLNAAPAPLDDTQIEQISQHYDHAVRHDLY
jgi:hypothetical protein